MRIERRGVFYSVEAVISTIMVLSILYIVTKNPPMLRELSKVNYKLKVHEALEVLEKSGDLRRYALTNDTTSIKNSLESMLPPEMSVFVVIYDESQVNLTQQFEAPFFLRDIVSVSYYIVGDIEVYSPREVRVYAWGFE